MTVDFTLFARTLNVAGNHTWHQLQDLTKTAITLLAYHEKWQAISFQQIIPAAVKSLLPLLPITSNWKQQLELKCWTATSLAVKSNSPYVLTDSGPAKQISIMLISLIFVILSSLISCGDLCMWVSLSCRIQGNVRNSAFRKCNNLEIALFYIC